MNYHTPSPRPQCQLLADEEYDFERDGVAVFRSFLSTDQINLLREAVDIQIAEADMSPSAYDFQALSTQYWRGDDHFSVGSATRFDMAGYHAMVSADKKARPLCDGDIDPTVPPGRFIYEAAGWKRFRGIRQVALDSLLPEAAAVLLRSEYINFWEDTTFAKGPNSPQRTAFHQDKSYFQIAGNKCCIVWIPLDPANRTTGAMEYVLGSHRLGTEYAPNVFFTQTPFSNSDAEPLPDIEAKREKYRIAMIEAEPGDVIIHHVLTIHGSGGNRSLTDARRAISFRYCGDDIRYRDRPGAIPQLGVTHQLKDGDVLDCADYPRVFPRPFPDAKMSRLYEDIDLPE